MNGVFDLNDGGPIGDAGFLARRDGTIGDFRDSEKANKRKIIEKMLTLRHNMKYNNHLLSVYMKAKGLFDKMVEEHRSQLYYLDEIYRHINQLIRENLSTSSKKPSGMLNELIKDKKRIGALLKRMRASYENLMNIDTVLGVTIDKINEVSFMDEDADADADDDDDDDDADADADADNDDNDADADNDDDELDAEDDLDDDDEALEDEEDDDEALEDEDDESEEEDLEDDLEDDLDEALEAEDDDDEDRESLEDEDDGEHEDREAEDGEDVILLY
jgi:hypothetical protein